MRAAISQLAQRLTAIWNWPWRQKGPLLVFLIAVIAIPVTVAAVVQAGGGGGVSQAQADRKVIFIQGIDSASGNCGETFQKKVSWMVKYLLFDPQALWVRELVPSLDSRDDFFYFSYRGLSGYCKLDFHQPQYNELNTCAGVVDAATKLDDFARVLISQFPDAEFDIIAHSMGGMVAAKWLRLHPDIEVRVNSVITFDSTLRGVPDKNPTSVCDTSSSLSWSDLWCQDSTQIPEKCASIIVPFIAGVGADVPFFTIDATQRGILGLVEEVPGIRTTLLSSASKLHCRFDDDHSSVWKRKRTSGDSVECWLHVTDPANPAGFEIDKPSKEIKAIFVACAVAEPAEPEACEARLRSDLPAPKPTGTATPTPTATPTTAVTPTPTPTPPPTAGQTPQPTTLGETQPPPPRQTPQPPPGSCPTGDQPIEYVVVEGDTTFGLAEFFGVDFLELLAFNGLTLDDVIQVGDVLLIPCETTSQPSPGPCPIEYVVVEGDTTFGLADFFGVDFLELLAFNGLTLDDVIQVGDVLLIPC